MSPSSLSTSKWLRWPGHALFWGAVLIFYAFYFGRAEDDFFQSLLFVSLLLPITAATTYFLSYYLIPRFLLQRKYWRFGLYFLYTMIGSVYLEMVMVVVTFIFIAQYEVAEMNPASFDAFGLLVGMYVVVFLAVSVNLLQRWYAMQKAHASLAQARLETELKLKDAELKLLKAQIHPHFLFNTLNNLYGLTLQRSDLAPEVVLRLSEMLDYMLYRCNDPAVPLDDEIHHLQNYLALERLRYDERVQVNFCTKGETARHRISPLLLLPFVENSFKHGISQDTGEAWVHIDLTVEDATLSFRIANSKPRHRTADEKGYTEGIGLTNVRKRLDHLYHDAYTLDIEEAPDSYRVDLRLNLQALS